MADLTLHRDAEADREDEGERGDRALARGLGIMIVPAPRTLTAGSLGGFREHVRQQMACEPKGIVIDCARLEYIDSSGLALLFSTAKNARRRRVGYSVARLNEDHRYLLSLTCIDQVISISETLRGAIAEASILDTGSERDSGRQPSSVETGKRPRLRLEP